MVLRWDILEVKSNYSSRVLFLKTNYILLLLFIYFLIILSLQGSGIYVSIYSFCPISYFFFYFLVTYAPLHSVTPEYNQALIFHRVVLLSLTVQRRDTV